MPSIVDAIKEKHPEATGSTIADVIRTSESGGSGSGGESNLVILPFTKAGNTIVTALTYSDITDVYEKYQSGDAVVLTIDMGDGRATLFVTHILYDEAAYGNPEMYAVGATGIHSSGDPNNTFVYLATVTFKNGAETIADVTIKRISLTD